MPIEMNVIQGQLATDCFRNEQARANAFAQALQVTFPLTATALNYGSTQPNVDQQSLPWIRTNGDGTIDGVYTFVNGFWVRPNPTPPSSPISYFWQDSLNSLALYDGGEGTFNINGSGTSSVTITPSIAISSTTGPMWQVNMSMMGLFPVGITMGVPVKDAYGNTVNGWALGQVGGEILHTLTVQELAPHTHNFNSVVNVSPGSNFNGGSSMANYVPTSVTGGDTINGVANTPIGHNNMPPYGTGYWIQRTARSQYRIG